MTKKMRKVVVLAVAGLGLSACSTYHRPSPEDRIIIVDSPADIMACRRLIEVSGGMLPTSPGFVHHLHAMLTATVAVGGTDLFLQRAASDWAYVRGIAFHCPFERRERNNSPTVRAKG